MRKEVAIVRKRIDMVNRDLKSLGQSCQKKVKSASMAWNTATMIVKFRGGLGILRGEGELIKFLRG